MKSGVLCQKAQRVPERNARHTANQVDKHIQDRRLAHFREGDIFAACHAKGRHCERVHIRYRPAHRGHKFNEDNHIQVDACRIHQAAENRHHNDQCCILLDDDKTQRIGEQAEERHKNPWVGNNRRKNRA